MAKNIIQLAFNGETSATSEELVYKYDYGQKIEFTDLELPEYFEVHFSGAKTGKATKQIGQNNIVDIPDGYLEKGSVYGWIFLHETETDGETEYEFKIPVKNRATPTDGEITPEQDSVISQTIAAMMSIKSGVESSASDASASATNAEASATAASASAQSAESAKDDAETAKDDAETAESNAETYAQSADNARQAAVTAQLAAESMATSAMTSSVEAEEAKDAAEDARDTILGMSAEATTLPAGSSATASYSDGLLSLGIPRGEKGEKGDTGSQGEKGDKGDTGIGEFFAEYGTTTFAEIEAAYNGGSAITCVYEDRGDYTYVPLVCKWSDRFIFGTINSTLSIGYTLNNQDEWSTYDAVLATNALADAKTNAQGLMGSVDKAITELILKERCRAYPLASSFAQHSTMMPAYIVSSATPFSAGWLSLWEDGSGVITPQEHVVYLICNTVGDVSEGDTYYWNGTKYDPAFISVEFDEDGKISADSLPYADGNTDGIITGADKAKYDNDVSLDELLDSTIVQTNTDTEPYSFRATPQCGSLEYDEIVGASVGWNQLVQNGDFADDSVWTNRSPATHSMAFANNKLSCTLNSVSNYIEYGQTFNAQSGHKYLISIGKVTTPHTIDNAYFSLSDSASVNSARFRSVATGTISSVISATANNSVMFIRCYINANGFEVGDVITFENVQVTDLTLAFGSTIADYVYSLEQSTAGAGVAWLKSHFDCFNSYQPYDSGSIESVGGLQSHEMVGFNQLGMANRTLEPISNGNYTSVPNIGKDKYYVGFNADLVARPSYVSDVAISDGSISFKANTTSGYGIAFPIKCLPNTEYYKCVGSFSNVNLIPVFLDGEGNFISRSTSGVANVSFTTPSDCHWILLVMSANAVGNVSVTDICINLSDTSKNGTYEPYIKHTYPLDSSLTLRGIYKMDASHNLYADGDVYASDGTVTRKYGVVDLGTLNWSMVSSGTYKRFYSNGIKDIVKIPSSQSTVPNILISGYETTNFNTVYASNTDKVCSITDASSQAKGNVNIVDNSHTDATAFKTAMSGVYLVYELATPTTETADPYTNPQNCEQGGTEEYISDSLIAIGHSTDYPLTLSDTMPSSNGTYVMQMTVTNGKRSIEWVNANIAELQAIVLEQ